MKITKKITMFTCSLLLTCGCLLPQLGSSVFAASEQDDTNIGGQTELEQEGIFTSIDKEGNVTYVKAEDSTLSESLQLPEETNKDATFDLKQIIGDSEPITVASFDTFEEANSAMTRQSKFRSVGNLAVYSDDQIRSITNGVVNFHTKPSTQYTTYTEDGTNAAGYINGAYGADAAYLGTNSDGTKVKFKMAGVTGWVNKSEVQILNYDSNAVQSVNYYEVEGGYIYHNITTNIGSKGYASTINVGPMQSYMKNGEYYYSYDGHYFYRTYAQMIADYKAGTYANSINANNPYYNYYQFLSFRTQTNYSAAQLNATLASNVGSTSKMWNQGDSFITNQNKYGANAALSFGVAKNESAWGMSNIAQTKNNLFGLKAYDSDPNNASGFISPADCIRQFAQTFVSITYTDPNDVSGLYHGACLGDKSVGFSIKYASDPYWGEKNATTGYTIANKTGNTSDINKYKIAIKQDHSNVNIRKEPTTSSTSLYKTGASSNYPFVVLGTVQGESVNGNTTWYKVATDAPLNPDRTKALQFNVNQGGEYNASISYAYVSATLVDVVSEGTAGGGSDGSTGTIKKGDVNGNGKIDAADYLMVMDTILGKYSMNDTQKKAADVNGNNKVDAADYLMIMDHILGKITIS